ncbi:unnamed protein product [Soboliphyme baturini]|uniref:Protein YIPF n=1 Tax=Soboliphyme baturini TaxID=241478 RepID=A0A183IDS8_9BILA|nr:unnamed protein product [Soboliphyme baturini]
MAPNMDSPEAFSKWQNDYSVGGGGFAARYLQRKGFGWLLEDEEDNEYQKPLSEELDINFGDIYYKVLCVLFPLRYFRLKLELVREQPDFWGPLFVVLMYALLSLYGQFSVVPWIMTVWFCGSFIVYFLTRVIGGEVSFSQCLGVIGYCILPLVVLIVPLSLVTRFPAISSILKVIINPDIFLCSIFSFLQALGIFWAVYSATVLLFAEEMREKRKLLLYPVPSAVYVIC